MFFDKKNCQKLQKAYRIFEILWLQSYLIATISNSFLDSYVQQRKLAGWSIILNSHDFLEWIKKYNLWNLKKRCSRYLYIRETFNTPTLSLKSIWWELCSLTFCASEFCELAKWGLRYPIYINPGSVEAAGQFHPNLDAVW